jgi:oligogalacturonide lyase
MAAVAGRLSGPEWRRYADPATEWDVIRLTDPSFASGMTAPHLRQFGRRSDTLVYWSARVGAPQVFQMDLKGGESHQLSEADALDCSSLALTADERAVCYFDGPALVETTLATLAKRTLHKVPDGATRTGLAQGFDGSLLFAETRDGRTRIQRTNRLAATNTVATVDGPVDLVMARPRVGQVLFRSGGEWFLVNFDGTGLRKLKLEAGQTGWVAWSPTGRSLLYLHIPDDPKQLVTLREFLPGDNSDHLVAKTSQFESVSANGDASVFVGASRSKASAYVLILLRVTRRELTLCEHRASDPRMVSPVFSPDSQSVFFTSDRHGHPALYRVHVDKFVEETTAG